MQYTLHQRKDHIVMKNNIQPENRILTIPNLLSAFRLLLIPLFVWLYLQGKYFYTGLVLLISGITDISDGFIARRFHMVSNVGKVLDPVADKLTQISMLICLVTRYPLMLILVVIMIFKELFMSISGLLVIHKTKTVFSADWHGKAATFLLYITMFAHVFWVHIPMIVSDILIVACAVMLAISLLLYGIHHIKTLRDR